MRGSLARRPGRALTAATVLAVAVGAAAREAAPAPPSPRPGAPRAAGGPVQEKLRERIEAAGVPARLSVGSTVIEAAVALPLFYERRGYVPAWSDEAGPLPALDSLVAALSRADLQGLSPRDYHLEEIRSKARRAREAGRATRDPGRLVDLELLATDGWLLLASHYLAGKVDPVTIDPEWKATPRDRDLASLLDSALAGDRVALSLEGLLPPQAGYRRLTEALARYRRIAGEGGWPIPGEGPTLRPGDRGERVAALRHRLRVTGDMGPGAAFDTAAGGAPAPAEAGVAAPDSFGAALEAAVKRFQSRQGLEADGVVGPATARALSVPVAARIQQIRANLERWRWLPEDLGRRHVLVNAADFRVDLVQDGRTVLTSRAIVGRPYRKTPVFSDRIRYIVLNPAWEVPPFLAVADELPLIRKDPGFLQRVGMKVIRGWGPSADTVDPATVDWNALGPGRFPYRLRQEPGPLNALGQVKIMFPNPFNVYLHDTPDHGLFARSTRAFSSGCIRVQRAVDLAAALLSDDDPSWTRERVDRLLAARAEQTLPLRRPVPVHILYWTAWSDPEGTMQFRPDVYARDAKLETALTEPPEAAPPTPTEPGPAGVPPARGGR